MRALPLAASLTLVLLAPSAAAITVGGTYDLATGMVWTQKACVDDHGVYLAERCRTPDLQDILLWVECVLDGVDDHDLGFEGCQWIVAMVLCSDIHALPCAERIEAEPIVRGLLA